MITSKIINEYSAIDKDNIVIDKDDTNTQEEYKAFLKLI